MGPILSPLSFRQMEKWSNKVADIKAHIKLVPPPRLKPSNIIATNHNWNEKNKKIDRQYTGIYWYKYTRIYIWVCICIYVYEWQYVSNTNMRVDINTYIHV